MTVIRDILDFFWRLVPANPILRRVVAGGGKRRRDMLIRCSYLGILVLVVVLVLLQSAGSVDRADLAALTKRSGQIFLAMSYAQLLLVSLLAPIFTAGAITQEKDSQTYDILLSTPLTNGQIVLGSFLSRLFFVVTLLISGIPIFSITQIFGGVAIRSIVQSFGIAAATAFVTGAMAMAISVLKVGTRRTIFSFYLFIVIFLAVPVAIEAMGYLRIAGAQQNTHVSWLTGLNPFLSLRVIFNDGKFVPPDAGQAHIAGYPAIVQWYLSSPHTFYVSAMFVLSFVLVAPSIVLLRRLAQSTVNWRGWLLQKLRLSTGDRSRKPRHVWVNPIAWREARTKASAARAVVLRYAFVAAGVLVAVILVWLYSRREAAPVVIGADGYNPNTQMVTLIDRGDLRSYRLVLDYTTNRTQIEFDGQTVGIDRLVPGIVVSEYKTAGASNADGQPLQWLRLSGPVSRLPGLTARRFLLGAILVEITVILLIVTQAAASTVTREKEDGTLDLLLSTPITSRYYIWGKLRGLVSFVLPLLAVPVFSIVAFIVHDVFRATTDPPGSFTWIVYPEALLVLPTFLVLVCALAAIVGMHMSLRCRKTVAAVMASVGIVMAVCVGLGGCAYSALANDSFGEAGLIGSALSPFTLSWVLIDPLGIASRLYGPGHETAGFRVLVVVSGWVITGVYAAVVWTMYKSMVRNFDMTIRKQAG